MLGKERCPMSSGDFHQNRHWTLEEARGTSATVGGCVGQIAGESATHFFLPLKDTVSALSLAENYYCRPKREADTRQCVGIPCKTAASACTRTADIRMLGYTHVCILIL